MKTSKEWVAHFRENLQHKRINWQIEPGIEKSAMKKIIPSVQAWQLGETSDGAHLLNATERYARRIGDPEYIEAVKLFIAEEQKHGSNLGRYLDAIGVTRLKKDWGDTLFRKVRYFNTSMELWTIAVIIVESFAQLFYRAVADGTKCVLLKQICEDILEDEAHHIRFQCERLCIITCRRSTWLNNVTITVYMGLFLCIMSAVWFGHGKAFKAGGYHFSRYWKESKQKFDSICCSLRATNQLHKMASRYYVPL